MKRPIIWLLVALFALGAALVACGLSTAATPTPATTTATETAIITIPPTETPRPTATPLGPGIYVEILPDGSMKMVDLLGAYQLVLPPKWVGLSLTQTDLVDIAYFRSVLTSADLKSFQTISQVSNCNPRMIFEDTDPLHYPGGGLITLLDVCMNEDEAVFASPLDAVIQAEAASLPDIMPGVETEVSTSTTAGGVPFGAINATWTAQGTTTFEKIVLFKANRVTIGLALVVLDMRRSTLEPILDQIMESVVLLNP
jgi:hypothetical protein